MTEQRPNPDVLLKQIQEETRHEERGKLKIYLGAAPGVGKTYTMLHDALEERSKGLDIVVGVAESHGRSEIDTMLKHFEILPKQTVTYHGKELLEFDLNAALKRHPALILMDEMAHSNAPGLHHKKRWQDIQELLNRGIDVYTTLNVQHIESLSDQVSQIIHAPVTETVSDTMIEMADTIELVDIPPEELLDRLHEGKVYFPDQANIAATMFFRKGNLIALRELALRVTAERVGAQVLLYRQGQGIQHIWHTKEKILVCVGSGLDSLKVIRAAKRMANALKGEWIAVHVDTPSIRASEEQRNRAMQNLQFAEQLGAETRVLTGFDIVHEIMAFARDQNVTQIMIWKHIRKRWRNLFFRNLVDEIVRNCGEIDVYIMTGTISEEEKKERAQTKKEIPWKTYAASILTVSIATVIDYFLFPHSGPSNLVMIYLLGITFIALSGRIGPSFLTSVLSVLAYDFFFIPPFYSLEVDTVQHGITLVAMFIFALIISYLTILTRRQATMARFTEHQTAALYTFTQQLARARGVTRLLDIGVSYIANVFESEVMALMPENNHLIVREKYGTQHELNEKEMGVAQWVYEMGQMAGLGTESLPFSDALYLPLSGAETVMGVLRIYPAQPKRLTSPEQMHLLEACVHQLALSLEVDYLHEQTKISDLQIEVEQVRNALLQVLSNDLRAPLLSIIDAATIQVENAQTLDANTIANIGEEIYIKATHASELLDNLLQITYLEAE